MAAAMSSAAMMPTPHANALNNRLMESPKGCQLTRNEYHTVTWGFSQWGRERRGGMLCFPAGHV